MKTPETTRRRCVVPKGGKNSVDAISAIFLPAGGSFGRDFRDTTLNDFWKTVYGASNRHG
jgi:hypothetical protein